MGRTYTVSEPIFEISVKTYETRRHVVTNEGSHVPLSSIAIPLAELGVPIPYVLGTQRIIAPQIWWYGNLRPIIKETRETSVQEDVVTYAPPSLLIAREQHITTETVTITRTITGYYLSMQFGVCLGPDVYLRGIWVDDVKVWSGNIGPGRTEFTVDANDTFLSGDCIWQGGAFGQAKDPFLSEHIDPDFLPGYTGMAYLIVKDIKASQISGRVSFEVSRFPDRLNLGALNKGGKDGKDINVASALADYIASDWGGAGAGIDAVDVDGTFATAAARLAEEGNYCSIIVTQESSTTQVMRALADQADGILFEDPELKKIKFRLVRFDQLNPLTGVTLDDRSITRINDWSRGSWVTTANKVRLTYTNRDKQYEEDSMIGYNFAAINERIKPNRPIPMDFPACMSSDVAEHLLSYNLSLVGKPVVKATVETNRKASGTLPGDTVRLLVPERGIGPVLGIATRVQRFPLGDNRTVISMVQVHRQDTDIVFDKDDTQLGDSFDIAIDDPTAVNVVQAPYWMARRKGITFLQTLRTTDKFIMPMFLPTKADNVQTSFGAYIGNYPNSDTPVQVVQNAEYPTIGELDDAIGQFDGIDTGTLDSITISSVTDNGHLISVGETGVRQGQVLLIIGNEILGFETATDNDDGTWTLSGIYRGLIDTAPQAHAAGSKVYIVGNSSSYIGPSINYPLGYTPEWRITSNTLFAHGDPTNADHYTTNNTLDLTASRIHPPIRPHDTKIDAADRSETAGLNELGETGLIVRYNQELAVTWKTRHKASAEIKFQSDDAEDAEIDATDPESPTYAVSRVMIRDSGNTLRSCGVTDDDDTYNALTVTVPDTTALGLGYLFVRTENSYGNSLFEDQLPVYVLDDAYYVREEADQYYISEDETKLWVGEGTD